MKWLVKLSGDIDDLKALADVCKSAELEIELIENEFFLKSAAFNILTDGKEVYEKAVELVSLITGASKVVLGSRKGLKVERGLQMEDDDGRKGGAVFVAEPAICIDYATGRVQITAPKPDDSTEIIYQSSPIPNWINIAKKDANVAKVLNILAENNLDLNKLNIIFEHIEGDVGSVSKKEWVSEKEKNRFTQSVQPERHGKSGLKKWKPAEKPMPYHEALTFIKKLISEWINPKIESQHST